MTASVEADLGLTSALRHEGALYIFRNDAQFASYAGALSASGDSDVQVLGREALIAKEPSLAAQADRIAGGFFSPHDSVGDCRLFASRVATALTERHDVTLLLGAEVTGFERRAGKIEAVVTDRGAVPAETVVLATGAQTPALTRRLGFAPNIYPVKGYSGTWHAPEDARLPRLPFIDETELMAVAAYGGLLRVTAQAEFAGHDRSLPADRTRPLRDYVARAFGDAVNPDAGEFWCGLRPSTPAGPPFLGRIREFDNLWINAGHGQLGWTMAAGCAALLAGHITGHGAALAGISSRARWLEDI
jgi:D-amino-acid dehydrogenase